MLFKNVFKHLANLKLFLVPILIFFWISSIFEQFLVRQIERLINSADPSTLSLILYGALHLLNGIIFPTLVSVLVLSRLRNAHQIPAAASYKIEASPFEQLFIETLRSWGMTIWWFFVLILPGLYKFIAYSYVPYIVFLNPAYDHGQIDALKASEQQFRRRWMATTLVFIVFYFVFPIMLSSFLDSYRDFNNTPFLAILVSALNGLISLLAFLLLAEMFLRDNPSLHEPISLV